MWGTRGWALSNARPPFFEACGRDPLPMAVGAEVVGVETCHQPSCKLALRAAEAHEGARGGGTCCLRVGRLGSGALPRPTTRPWGLQAGPATYWLWVRGMWA